MKIKDAQKDIYKNIFKKCKSFDDLYNITEDMTKIEKDNVIGNCFLLHF